jgi:hypothetical protein
MEAFMSRGSDAGYSVLKIAVHLFLLTVASTITISHEFKWYHSFSVHVWGNQSGLEGLW